MSEICLKSVWNKLIEILMIVSQVAFHSRHNFKLVSTWFSWFLYVKYCFAINKKRRVTKPLIVRSVVIFNNVDNWVVAWWWFLMRNFVGCKNNESYHKCKPKYRINWRIKMYRIYCSSRSMNSLLTSNFIDQNGSFRPSLSSSLSI